MIADIISLARTYLDAAHSAGYEAGQLNGVAWTVSVVDDLHINGQGQIQFDSTYKGIKNTIRDRFKAETGVDPAPSYPIKVELAHPSTEGKGSQPAEPPTQEGKQP